MTDTVATWLDAPAPSGIAFLGSNTTWEHSSYADLAGGARGVSTLIADTVAPGSRVAVVSGLGPALVHALFGIWHAGCVAAILPPMTIADRVADHRVSSLAKLDVLAPDAVLFDPAVGDEMRGLLVASAVPMIELDGRQFEADEASDRRSLADDAPALIQFTSGSSGRPRAVSISAAGLAANVLAIRSWLGMTPADGTASWLPVHHDMGLIGCFLTPVVNQSPLWLLEPQQFVRNPFAYVDLFGSDEAHLTAMPNFGLDYIARRVDRKPERLTGDFSTWRTVIIGAERVRAESLASFSRCLGPLGFDATAFRPAYGLAEATLAVTGKRTGRAVRSLRVDRTTLRWGEAVPESSDATALVSCGPPLDGVSVRVCDVDGTELPERSLGEIVVDSSSTMLGYLQDESDVEGRTRLVGTRLATGDAGFLDCGELFVLARMGDAMKVRGRSIFAEDLEEVAVAEGIDGRRIAVLLAEEPDPTALIVIEQLVDSDRAVVPRLQEQLGPDIAVELIAVPRSTIPRTTSGKPRRRILLDLVRTMEPSEVGA